MQKPNLHFLHRLESERKRERERILYVFMPVSSIRKPMNKICMMGNLVAFTTFNSIGLFWSLPRTFLISISDCEVFVLKFAIFDISVFPFSVANGNIYHFYSVSAKCVCCIASRISHLDALSTEFTDYKGWTLKIRNTNCELSFSPSICQWDFTIEMYKYKLWNYSMQKGHCNSNSYHCLIQWTFYY